MKHLIALAAVCGVLAATPADSATDRAVAPLFDGLGNLHHAVTTPSRKAQRYFDQGLTLCYAFNHKEAIRSFQGAAKHDPECAMAWWGVAYACGPHVNKPMSKEENDQAWSAIEKALALKAKAGPKEQAFIEAMAKRYQPAHLEDRSELDKAYAAAMREVVRQYPDDLDAQTMLAEALMDTMPWDYWTKDRSAKPETEEALAALRFVMARNPDHPGANHLYIHAVEAGPNPQLGLPSADRLGGFAPQAGHLVHMPSHIYMRVGQYQDAIRANELAVKADQSYLRHCRAQGFYPGAYYPHNLHFLWWAQVFEGRSADALRSAAKVAEIARENYCGPSKAVEAPRLRHLPWLTLAQFGRWKEILAIAEPPATNDFLVDRALWHFSRGLAQAALGDVASAEKSRVALAAIVTGDEVKKLDSPNFPASETLEVAGHWLAGKVAGARGDKTAAVGHFEKAAAAEHALPYMEPSFWPFPVRPALGAALLDAGDPVRAEKVFRENLAQWNRNPRGLFGLEAALRRQNKEQSADLVRREFEQAWKRSDTKLDLGWF